MSRGTCPGLLLPTWQLVKTSSAVPALYPEVGHLQNSDAAASALCCDVRCFLKHWQVAIQINRDPYPSPKLHPLLPWSVYNCSLLDNTTHRCSHTEQEKGKKKVFLRKYDFSWRASSQDLPVLPLGSSSTQVMKQWPLWHFITQLKGQDFIYMWMELCNIFCEKKSCSQQSELPHLHPSTEPEHSLVVIWVVAVSHNSEDTCTVSGQLLGLSGKSVSFLFPVMPEYKNLWGAQPVKAEEKRAIK